MFSRLMMIPVTSDAGALQRIGLKSAQDHAKLKDELTNTDALRIARAALKKKSAVVASSPAKKKELVEDDEWEESFEDTGARGAKEDEAYIKMIAKRAEHTD